MIVRVGIEGGRRACLAKAKELGAPLLVSAGSLWDARRQTFGGWQAYRGFDTALDSGGFVAMRLHGGYRWSVEQYAALAREMAPTWWAQMDFCCEPEIAGSRQEVARRIDRTVEGLNACQEAARAAGASEPMPVLQGWEARDYCQGPIFDPGYRWPGLVGVGSVCRRAMGGSSGVLAIMAALDRAVPQGVRFHLFGVKSQAMRRIAEAWPARVASVDSMAWNVAARWDAIHAGRKCDGDFRALKLGEWYAKQTAETAQQLLNL